MGTLLILMLLPYISKKTFVRFLAIIQWFRVKWLNKLQTITMNADNIKQKNAERKRKNRESQTPEQNNARRIVNKESIIRWQQKIRLHEYRVSQTPEQRNFRLKSELKQATTQRFFDYFRKKLLVLPNQRILSD